MTAATVRPAVPLPLVIVAGCIIAAIGFVAVFLLVVNGIVRVVLSQTGAS